MEPGPRPVDRRGSGLRPGDRDGMQSADPRPELTEAEARVAALVLDGASNREVATALFLSVKTVESMLTRIYRKLGVRSRTQLGTVLRTPPSAVLS